MWLSSLNFAEKLREWADGVEMPKYRPVPEAMVDQVTELWEAMLPYVDLMAPLVKAWISTLPDIKWAPPNVDKFEFMNDQMEQYSHRFKSWVELEADELRRHDEIEQKILDQSV